MEFSIGDRVVRRTDVYDQDSPLMHGKVVAAYSDFDNRFGSYPELYDVEWDSGEIKMGYLPHGIAKEMEFKGYIYIGQLSAHFTNTQDYFDSLRALIEICELNNTPPISIRIEVDNA